MTVSRMLFAAFLWTLLVPCAADAGSTGKIAGTIRDARTKEALPGVNVLVKGTLLGATTDLQGRYAILNIPPGNYMVTASFIGYRRFEVSNLGAHPGVPRAPGGATTELPLGLIARVRVVFAPDSFKGSLTSVEVATALASGWRSRATGRRARHGTARRRRRGDARRHRRGRGLDVAHS